MVYGLFIGLHGLIVLGAGFTEPAGSGSGRFPTGLNSKFEFKFKKKRKSLTKFSKILQSV
jgi:hypothetical protein